jgi:Plavaka transposase
MRIPQVRQKLGLSFRNTRALHKIIDDIPHRAGKWQTKHLSFKDRPAEKHVVRFRDVIEAIRCLWGDPALSESMVYIPKKVYSDVSRSNRVYSEMWTGSWWHVIQVCNHSFSTLNSLKTVSCLLSDAPPSRCNSGTCDTRDGQNPTYPVHGWQVCVSCLSHVGKSTQNCSKKAFSARSSSSRLSFGGQNLP